jgi:hypothetical protein
MNVVALNPLLYFRDQAAPATSLYHSKDRNGQGAEPDEKELEHLIEDGRVQAA